jgi:hypothetical protein
MQYTTWAAVKFYLDDTLISAKYTVDDSFYYIFADNFFTRINLTLPGDADDLTDWVDNYLPNANLIANEVAIKGGTDGTLIGNAGDRLKIDVEFSNDQLIKVSSDDQTMGYLGAKVVGTSGKTVVSVLNDGGDEDLQINIGSDVFDKVVDDTGDITEGSKLFFTDERAQDAVGTILTDTASIDFTYSDATPSITAVVLPAGVDHNSLANLTTGDVHTQYLPRSGVRAMTGNLDMGAQSITNVNLVDGIDVTAHASRHLPSGADPLTTASASSLTTSSTNATGSANSLARSDHTHAVSIVYGEATGTGTTTTTSSTPVLMAGMTLTPVAGTYMVWFSTSVQSDDSGSFVIISIYSGGSQIGHSIRRVMPRFDASGGLGGNSNTISCDNIGTHGIVTVNGAQAIEGRWQIFGGGTATGFERTLNIIKLSN